MFNNDIPYTLRTVIDRDVERYYVSFSDGQATPQETEVSRSVYLELQSLSRYERRLRRWDERYAERLYMSEETLFERALHPQEDIEEAAFASIEGERLRQAIRELPETQRRRFILYHEHGLTYEQIAEAEGCTKMPVKRSIDRAGEKIKKFLKI